MPIDLNLIPEALLEAQTRRRHLRAWVVSIAPALGLLLIVAGLNWVRQARTDQAAAAAEALGVQLEQARAEVRSLTAAVNETSLRLKRAEALQSKRSWSGLMGLLAEARPEDVWFSTVTTDPPAPMGGAKAAVVRQAPAGKPVEAQPVTIDAPRKLLISGYSLSPTGPLSLVTNLKDENIFTRVALEKSMRGANEQESRFEFDIVVEW
jgi:Tfp pilus assembly protein PilN